MKVSWVILTFNRFNTVRKSFKHNLDFMGTGITSDSLEIIWVDNGSHEDKNDMLLNELADVKIFNKFNLGVAKGYNRGMAMATGDLIAITGCDRLMPKNWLRNALDAHIQIPGTGIVSYFSKLIADVPERTLGPSNVIQGIEIQPALPLEAKIFSKKLQSEIGYFKEDLGLYGWEDVLWAERAEQVCLNLALLNYTLPGQIAQHLGDEGIHEWKNGGDDKAYHEFKRKEALDPRKKEICEEHRRQGFPYYNPYI